MTQPDPTHLLEIIGPDIPLVGFYDAPDTAPFSPLVTPVPGQRRCIFAFYPNWLRGETLYITRENLGGGGAGRAVRCRDRSRGTAAGDWNGDHVGPTA